MDLSIRVTVSYRANPPDVRQALLQAASACAAVAREPAPAVLLDDFATNGFAFVLRANAAAGEATDDAASRLRFAIVDRFQGAGIEFAVPQADVRWRDLDFIRNAFMLAANPRRDKEDGGESIVGGSEQTEQ